MGFALLFVPRALREAREAQEAKDAREESTCNDDQALGQRIGHMEVLCTLKASSSQWTEKDAGITGLLYFNIEYNDNEAVPLRSAFVQIDVGAKVNGEPIPIFEECAPLSAITGAPARQHIVDTTRTDPRVVITTPFGGVEGSGHSHEVNREINTEHRWSFKASNCSDNIDTSVTRSRFIWMRTLLDRTGTNRPYRGALVVHRGTNQQLVLRVKVEAQPWHWYHRVQHSEPLYSKPIAPNRFEDRIVFGDLRNNIQGRVITRNRELAATGKF